MRCITTYCASALRIIFIIIVTVAGPRVCVCVCVCVCVSVRIFLPLRASRPRNIGTYVFTVTQKKLFNNIIVIFVAENGSFRSYDVICLPRMPQTTPRPQKTDTFVYILLAHILNINMRTYVSGCVRADAFNLKERKTF